ncbi:universal stress protein family [Synechococcus sp. PCC 7335]|uniref:universal stress protein n=1 Tax=Synechococcus sp. (strain ATCC 29403 / PCC 7335) TaxID=91464 RepID=UPI00017EB070|nr:universal stress protein [Synechococcus sp. PCC 7335]EDX86116.1 universal stress protein family [Synechococcus sp. PCC 7335]
MFKRVLICTDFTDSLQRFVDFVPDLSKGCMTHIVFFHNVPLMTSREIPCVDEERVEAARERLAVAQSAVPDGTTVKIEVASGRASDNIVRAVKEHRPDIIFSGMPTRSVLNERLFGSTTMALAEKTQVPLLILRPQLLSTYRESELAQRCQNMFDYLLLPYDGSESADHLVDEVKTRIQADPGCATQTCLLSWVIDGGGRIPSSDLTKEAKSKLEKVAAQLRGLGSQIETEVRLGSPVEEILKSGEVHDISAIAVCTGKSKGLLKLTVPSFTSAMLRASWHPIVHFPRYGG